MLARSSEFFRSRVLAERLWVQPDRERLSKEQNVAGIGFRSRGRNKTRRLRLVLGGRDDTVVMFRSRDPSKFEWTVLNFFRWDKNLVRTNVFEL
jgi:hypothetical protein